MRALREKLIKDLDLLKKQRLWLRYSLKECIQINPTRPLSPQEFGAYETLCSRYARSIDFLIRKAFRTIDAFEFENRGTLVDVVNNALKRGLIDDIEEFRQMKGLRNEIVHEYVEENLLELFKEVQLCSRKSTAGEKLFRVRKTYSAPPKCGDQNEPIYAFRWSEISKFERL